MQPLSTVTPTEMVRCLLLQGLQSTSTSDFETILALLLVEELLDDCSLANDTAADILFNQCSDEVRDYKL